MCQRFVSGSDKLNFGARWATMVRRCSVVVLVAAGLGVSPCAGSRSTAVIAGADFPSSGGADKGLYRRAFRPERLYLPTLMEKFADHYFIVDSYNNRVLYSKSLDLPLDVWRVLDGELSRPHSIASDGRWLVVDDTDAHRVNVYERRGDDYVLTERIGGVGRRPHRVLYDAQTRAFYVLASASQQITKLATDAAGLVIEHTRDLPFLNGAYTRSMAIIEGRMVFVSGPGAVVVVDHASGNYAVVDTFPVPHRYASMNDIAYIHGHYYLTATMNRMARCDSLAALAEDRCESVYDKYGLRGNPYYFSRVDDRYFLGEVAGRDAILEFTAHAGELRLVRVRKFRP